jgi:hypothetical protein
MKVKLYLLLFLAIAFGIAIAYFDTRPNWDDTGITVGAIFLSAGLFGALMPKKAWVWALAIGVWVPLLNIYYTGNYGSLIALIIAYAGAFAVFLLLRFFNDRKFIIH